MAENNILSNQYLICCLDILGYKNLVDDTYKNSDEQAVLNIQYCIEDACSQAKKTKKEIEKTKEENPTYKIHSDIYKEFDKRFKIRIISDTIIISLILNDFDRYEDLIKRNITEIFLNYIRFFIISFMSKIRYFLRGGISLDLHYEKEFKTEEDSSLFIFSKAFINAYLLEEEAKFPRIILDKKSQKFIKKNGCQRFLFKDNHDSQNCLDLYAKFDETDFNKITSEIDMTIDTQITKNQGRPKVLEKITYYKNYHENKKKTLKGKVRLKINIDEIEQK